jgi:hypothetical protein
LQRQQLAQFGQLARIEIGFENAEPKTPGLTHSNHV